MHLLRRGLDGQRPLAARPRDLSRLAGGAGGRYPLRPDPDRCVPPADEALSRLERKVKSGENRKTRRGKMGGVHKTVNSHSSLLCFGCSCILFCYVITWNRTDL